MRLTKKQKTALLVKYGRYVEETGDYSEQNNSWYWPMRIHKDGSVTHARWPKRTEDAAWQAIAKRHLMH